MKAILLFCVLLLTGCASFWDHPAWALLDIGDDDPKKATIVMEDGTVYEAEEVQ